MKYISVFRTSAQLNNFIKDSMKPMGRSAHKISIEIMMWRLSKTVIGSELLKRYSLAMENPNLWRETVAYLLQSLAGLFKVVQLCASGTHPDEIRNALNSRDKVKLSDIIKGADSRCSSAGYNPGELFAYIMDCRNIYIHSGIMPYKITTSAKTVSLNDFLKTKFRDDPTVLTAQRKGSAVFNSEGDNEKFRCLCNLILAALWFYFDAVNPSLSKYALWRSFQLYSTMVGDIMGKTIIYSIASVYAGGAMVVTLIKVGIYTLLILLLFVFISWLIGLMGSKKTEQITDVDPRELVERVNQITPYEQMKFLYDRRSSLAALGIQHEIGSEPSSPADIMTDSLYEEFKSCPDPKTHLLSFMPNAVHLSHYAIIGWPYSQSWSRQKLFTYDSSAENKKIEYLPIYAGDYYPLGWLNARNPQIEKIRLWCTRIAKYPKLNVLILYGAKGETKYTEENRELALELKIVLEKAGVKSRNIRIAPDMTKSGGVVLAVGGVFQYSSH